MKLNRANLFGGGEKKYCRTQRHNRIPLGANFEKLDSCFVLCPTPLNIPHPRNTNTHNLVMVEALEILLQTKFKLNFTNQLEALMKSRTMQSCCDDYLDQYQDKIF